jgi:hypothetical protein
MYIFKSFNYCFYGRMMPCTPGIWELENKTDHINTAEHPGFWSLIEWCLACVLPQSRTFQCWPVLASNDWLDDKGEVESMSLSFPDTFPLTPSPSSAFQWQCESVEWGGLLFCFQMEIILEMKVLMKWKSLEKAIEKHIFLLQKPKHNPPERHLVYDLLITQVDEL